MSCELLEMDDIHRDLTKCDIFSLGCTVYQISLNIQLPAHGDGWLAIRSGQILPVPGAPNLTQLIRTMMQPEPSARPSAQQLLHNHNHPQLQSEVERALDREQQRNQKLTDALTKQHMRTRLCRSNTWT